MVAVRVLVSFLLLGWSFCGTAHAGDFRYRVYHKQVPRGAPPPDRIVTGWDLLTPIGGGACGITGTPCVIDADCNALGDARNKCTVPDGDVSLNVLCEGDVDVYIAVSLVFADGFETNVVGPSPEMYRCFHCSGTDSDGDGYCAEPESGMAIDCDDTNAAVRPHGEQVCDGLNNDCSHPHWPELEGTDEFDRDGDGYSRCGGDCHDGAASVHPRAPELCDGRNNDCLDDRWPALPPTEIDADGDSFTPCRGDCDDTRAIVFPGAPPRCDRINNDCSDPQWPRTQPSEQDNDGDGYSPCEGDCNDSNPAVTFAAVAPKGACSKPAIVGELDIQSPSGNASEKP